MESSVGHATWLHLLTPGARNLFWIQQYVALRLLASLASSCVVICTSPCRFVLLFDDKKSSRARSRDKKSTSLAQSL